MRRGQPHTPALPAPPEAAPPPPSAPGPRRPRLAGSACPHLPPHPSSTPSVLCGTWPSTPGNSVLSGHPIPARGLLQLSPRPGPRLCRPEPCRRHLRPRPFRGALEPLFSLQGSLLSGNRDLLTADSQKPTLSPRQVPVPQNLKGRPALPACSTPALCHVCAGGSWPWPWAGTAPCSSQ